MCGLTEGAQAFVAIEAVGEGEALIEVLLGFDGAGSDGVSPIAKAWIERDGFFGTLRIHRKRAANSQKDGFLHSANPRSQTFEIFYLETGQMFGRILDSLKFGFPGDVRYCAAMKPVLAHRWVPGVWRARETRSGGAFWGVPPEFRFKARLHWIGVFPEFRFNLTGSDRFNIWRFRSDRP